MNHWIIAPIVLPLAAGALLLVLERADEALARTVSMMATVALTVITIGLVNVSPAQASSRSITSATGRHRSGSCWCWIG